jgi:hypothetical protein
MQSTEPASARTLPFSAIAFAHNFMVSLFAAQISVHLK